MSIEAIPEQRGTGWRIRIRSLGIQKHSEQRKMNKIASAPVIPGCRVFVFRVLPGKLFQVLTGKLAAHVACPLEILHRFFGKGHPS